MAVSNRANRLTKLVGDLRKRFQSPTPQERPLFETLLFATLVENSPAEAAETALTALENAYFDWNEVRVSSRPELAERLKPLNDPAESADRLKRTLQSVFESIYAFDLEPLKKKNLGDAVKQLNAYDGVTPFVVAYATQRGLSGHSIAVNSGVLLALQVMEIITEAEAKKKTVPGLERAIPKNKGVEAQLVLHAMGVEISKNPYGPAARKLLTDLDPTCKNRLPKRPAKAEPAKKKPAKAAAPKAKPAEPAKKQTAKAAPAPKKPASKAAAKPTKKKAEPPKKAATATKAVATKSTTKKATPKKSTATKKAPKKSPTKKAAPKKAAKKPAKKKVATKAAKTTKKTTTKKPAKKRNPK